MSLPNSWVVTPLSNLLDQIVGGGTPSKVIAANFIGTVPFMTVKDMKARFISDTADHISEEAVASSATTKIPADTLVVATRMSLGKIVRPSVEVAINQDLKALFPSAGINKTYIEYFWRSKSDFIQSKGTGTTVKGIRIEDIKNLEVPLAPENEQRRIADKLDTTLARVDALNDRLARITPLLKRFRQSVLAAATSGRLTEDWRDGVGEWREVKISDIGVLGRGKSRHRPRNDPALYGGVHPFIQTGDVANAGDYIVSHSQTYSELGLLQSKLWPANTLCITIAANIADTAILSYPACFPDSIVGFVANEKICRVKYVKWFIDSIKDRLEQFAPATAQKNINLAVLEDIKIKLPPLDEQTEIVRRVETLFAFADRLQDRLQSAQTAAERLTPALLAKAFRGELVPQDPNDEPATELLRRLRAARAADTASKPKRGRAAKASTVSE